jgi:threonine/homoserine/homoserine lactone efflux protein
VAAGQAVWTLASSAGLGALLVSGAPLFGAVKLAGATYLVVLGLQSLRRAWRSVADGAAAAPSRHGAVRQGLLGNVGNPAVAASQYGAVAAIASVVYLSERLTRRRWTATAVLVLGAAVIAAAGE